MVQKTMSPEGTSSSTRAVEGWPAEVSDLLGRMSKLLDEGQPAAALELLGRNKQSSPWLTNAAAVCQLRLGNTSVAVDALRGLVLSGLFLRPDVPTVFKLNFAVALIVDGNLPGGERVLHELRSEDHPAVRELREELQRWSSSMTFWQKLRYTVGGTPPRPFVLESPPGRLV